MSATENKELLGRYLARVWEHHDLDALDDLLSPTFARHVAASLPPLDRTAQRTRLEGFREAFPDVTIEVEDVVAEDDRIAFRSTMRGTHLGEFLGIAPTGRTITVGLVDIVRVEEGRFAEQWGGPDLFDLVRQLEGEEA